MKVQFNFLQVRAVIWRNVKCLLHYCHGDMFTFVLIKLHNMKATSGLALHGQFIVYLFHNIEQC